MERNGEEFDFTPIDDGKDGCKIMDVTSRMRYSSAPMHSRFGSSCSHAHSWCCCVNRTSPHRSGCSRRHADKWVEQPCTRASCLSAGNSLSSHAITSRGLLFRYRTANDLSLV